MSRRRRKLLADELQGQTHPEAERDLLQWFEFVLQIDLNQDGNPALAQRALHSINEGLATLERFPFNCRNASENAFLEAVQK